MKGEGVGRTSPRDTTNPRDVTAKEACVLQRRQTAETTSSLRNFGSLQGVAGSHEAHWTAGLLGCRRSKVECVRGA
jgi:hypothetical protein